MKLILTCIVLSVYLTSALAGPTKGQLVWSDEFDGNKLNEGIWNIITGNGCPHNCFFGNSMTRSKY